jgi:hypothetical protein
MKYLIRHYIDAYLFIEELITGVELTIVCHGAYEPFGPGFVAINQQICNAAQIGDIIRSLNIGHLVHVHLVCCNSADSSPVCTVAELSRILPDTDVTGYAGNVLLTLLPHYVNLTVAYLGYGSRLDGYLNMFFRIAEEADIRSGGTNAYFHRLRYRNGIVSEQRSGVTCLPSLVDDSYRTYTQL